MVSLSESDVMHDFVLLGLSTAQAAGQDGGRCTLLKLTTGSQGLVVRTHCIVKGRGRGGTSGRKGATYKKRATVSPNEHDIVCLLRRQGF